MGKKTESVKTGTALAEAPESKKKAPETVAPVVATAPVVAVNGTKAKAPAKKKPAAKPAAKAATKKVVITTEDIALRAYYISEERQRQGIHGDSHSDWVEAERQLKAEKRKAAKKPATPKKKA